jgi:hypothetical protein
MQRPVAQLHEFRCRFRVIMKSCIVTGGNQGAHTSPSRRLTAGSVIRRDAISSSNRALIPLRRHGPRLREAPRVTRLVSASARRTDHPYIYAPRVPRCRPPTLTLRRAGPSTYLFAARTRAIRQLQKSKVRSHSDTERTPSHRICASGQVVGGVHVSAAASSAQAANVSFGIMDLNVSRCRKITASFELEIELQSSALSHRAAGPVVRRIVRGGV